MPGTWVGYGPLSWPTLPDPVRAGILAMVEATAGA